MARRLRAWRVHSPSEDPVNLPRYPSRLAHRTFHVSQDSSFLAPSRRAGRCTAHGASSCPSPPRPLHTWTSWWTRPSPSGSIGTLKGKPLGMKPETDP